MKKFIAQSKSKPRPGRPRVIDPTRLRRLLGEGKKQVQIAEVFGVRQGSIARAVKKLRAPDRLEVVKAKVRVTLRRVDPIAQLLTALEAINRDVAMLNDPAARQDFFRKMQLTDDVKTATQWFALQRDFANQLPRLVQTLVTTSAKLVEVAGVERWVREFLGLVDEVDPSLRQRLVDRIIARGLLPVSLVKPALTEPLVDVEDEDDDDAGLGDDGGGGDAAPGEAPERA